MIVIDEREFVVEREIPRVHEHPFVGVMIFNGAPYHRIINPRDKGWHRDLSYLLTAIMLDGDVEE